MKRLIIIFSLLTFSIVLMAEQKKPLPETKIVKINKRVYALLGPEELPNRSNRGYMVNSTVIIGDEGVVLIDTGFSDEIGRHLKKAIASITKKPVTHVINTHNHGDHILGNSAFESAIIMSSDKCRQSMEKAGYEWIALLESITGQRFPNTRPVVAEKSYAEDTRTMVTLQNVRMQIWVPSGSHTDNDLMVYLPDDKVLVAGDIVVNTIMPSYRDAKVRNWLATLQEISEMPLVTIVPGHGKLTTPAKVKKLRQMMSTLYAGVEVGYKKGMMDSEIRKTLDLQQWKKLKNFDDLMGTNINRTYLEVEDANF